MDEIIAAAGTALVGAMATDAWQQARAEIVALWRRVHPTQTGIVKRDLAVLRRQVLAARQSGRNDTEQALICAWQERLRQTLRGRPGLADELRRLLDETLMSALDPGQSTTVGRVSISSRSHDSSVTNIVTGSQINYNYRSPTK